MTEYTGTSAEEKKDPNYVPKEDTSCDSDEEPKDFKEDFNSESDDSDIADFADFNDEDVPDFLDLSSEEREEIDQDEYFLRRMLKRDSEYVFADKDLLNESTLNRAIDLLHHKRQGQNEVTRVLGHQWALGCPVW